ncbi:hypothetical protein AMTRI_Chr10g224950 [Amborella trichopoda]|uniref:Uncharacterized protein n=1 Tax=Amborella trichopoda TaxID=13333 RepID=W1NXD0_AMBTC|nr:hypothetical protein AMTR_s00110p00109540 [Amborella trichopoda]
MEHNRPSRPKHDGWTTITRHRQRSQIAIVDYTIAMAQLLAPTHQRLVFDPPPNHLSPIPETMRSSTTTTCPHLTFLWVSRLSNPTPAVTRGKGDMTTSFHHQHVSTSSVHAEQMSALPPPLPYDLPHLYRLYIRSSLTRPRLYRTVHL